MRSGLLDSGTRRCGNWKNRLTRVFECGDGVGEVGIVAKVVLHCQEIGTGVGREKKKFTKRSGAATDDHVIMQSNTRVAL